MFSKTKNDVLDQLPTHISSSKYLSKAKYYQTNCVLCASELNLYIKKVNNEKRWRSSLRLDMPFFFGKQLWFFTVSVSVLYCIQNIHFDKYYQHSYWEISSKVGFVIEFYINLILELRNQMNDMSNEQ